MSLGGAAIMAAVRSHGLGTGLFEAFEGHEKLNGTIGGLSGEVFFSGLRPVPAASGLAETSARLEFTVRLRIQAMRQPLDDIELDLMNATDVLMAAYSGDFTLGGLIRNVDLLGAAGDPLRATPGFVTLNQTMYRAVGIGLPMIVNSVWEQVP